MSTSNDAAQARKLANELAATMGWLVASVREDWESPQIVREDGARILVHVGGWQNEGRVSLRGLWPRFADGAEYCTGKKSISITCALTRGAEAIAKDIARRLLPDYDPAYADALRYVKRRDMQEVEAKMTARRVAVAIGGTMTDRSNGMRRGDGIQIFDEPKCVRRLIVREAYEGIEDRPVSVSFQVHDLDPNLAVELLTRIREFEMRQEQEQKLRVSIEASEEDEKIELPPIEKIMRVGR